MNRHVIATERRRGVEHVVVQLRGFGEPGSRPLLGEVVCSPAEADYLTDALHAAAEAFQENQPPQEVA